MRSRSTFPFRSAEGMSEDLIDYFDQIGTPLPPISDLAASPTTTEIATAFNALLTALRDAKKMDT
jgi:hypothetical protein